MSYHAIRNNQRTIFEYISYDYGLYIEALIEDLGQPWCFLAEEQEAKISDVLTLLNNDHNSEYVANIFQIDNQSIFLNKKHSIVSEMNLINTPGSTNKAPNILKLLRYTIASLVIIFTFSAYTFYIFNLNAEMTDIVDLFAETATDHYGNTILIIGQECNTELGSVM